MRLRCANVVLVVTRIAVLGARSAPRDTGNQPRRCQDIKGGALGWFDSSISSNDRHSEIINTRQSIDLKSAFV